MKQYSVSLLARNELVRYQDSSLILHFSTKLSAKRWLVYLPPSRGRGAAPHALSPSESNRVLPRLERFLSRIWWFGVWPVSYSVSFVGAK